MKKRILSLLVALCMLLAVMPLTPITTTAKIVIVPRNIMLGTSVIQDPTEVTNSSGKYYRPNSYIYFGRNGTTPIKWRVLDADKANDGVTSGMFLLSEYVLATGVPFNTDSTKENANQYQGSDAQIWCKNFATNASNFSSIEENAMLGIAKTDSAETLYNMLWNTGSLTTADKVFYLSAQELAKYVANYRRAENLIATDTAEKKFDWFLRSSRADLSDDVGCVETDGFLRFGSVSSKYKGVRPAMNLDLSNIISPAEGGKTSGNDAADGTTGMFENKNYPYVTGNYEFKLTMLDESRTAFTVALKSFSTNTAVVSYSGAKTGTNEYISAMIQNGNTVKYYGRIAVVSSATGEARISMPSDFDAANGDRLYVFNEQYNGDKMTDYASPLVFLDVSNMVHFDANGGTGTMLSQVLKKDTDEKLSANSFTRSGYTFTGWNTKADGTGTAYSDQQLVKNLQTTLYAQWRAIPAEKPTVSASDVTVTYGQSKSLAVIVSEQNGYTYSYQWYNASKKAITGETSKYYALPSNLTVGSYGYSCAVTATRTDNGETAITEKKITVTVNPATAALTAPTAQNEITYGQALSAVRLPAGWVWANGNIVPSAGGRSYTAYYTPTDTKNYDWTAITGWNETEKRVERKVMVTVNPATAALTAPTAQNEITYGQALSAVRLPAGWVWANGNIVPSAGGRSYTAYYTPTDTKNYDWTKIDGWNQTEKRVERTVMVTVNQATLTVKAKAKAITYGEAPTNNGVTYQGFVNGETEAVLKGTLAFDYNYAQYGDAGTFTITPKGLTSDNYIITFEKGALTVNPKEVSVSWSDTEFVYDGTVHKPTATTTDFIPGDAVALTVSGAQRDANKSNETYTATVAITGAKAANYKFAGNTATTTKFTVKKAEQTAPSGLTGTAETIDGKADGKITGVSTGMEYRKLGETSYTAIKGTELTNLANGVYYVRYQASGNYNPSPDKEVTIAAGGKLTVTIPSAAEQIGYQLIVNKTQLVWNDSVEITFRLLDGYSKLDGFAVKVNAEPIQLGKEDKYTIANIQKAITVTVDGVGDDTAPVISGIENGKTYCSARTVTVSDVNEVTVTVNNRPVTLTNGTFILSFAEGVQTIVATDKPGNQTQMAVTVNNGHTGGTADCTHKAECAICKEAYGEVDTGNHATLKHIEAKSATVAAEGNREYWYCESCHRCFSDKDGEKEITLAATVIAKLTNPDSNTDNPRTGDHTPIVCWFVLVILSGCGIFGAICFQQKKKSNRKA